MAGIVDQMKRRVIELISGQVVRDERKGGYLTQTVPVQRVGADEYRIERAFGELPKPGDPTFDQRGADR